MDSPAAPPPGPSSPEAGPPTGREARVQRPSRRRPTADESRRGAPRPGGREDQGPPAGASMSAPARAGGDPAAAAATPHAASTARLADFLMALRVESGLSRNTLDAYRRDLRDLLAFGAARGVERLEQFDRDHVYGWLESLRERGLAPASVARKLSAASVWFAHEVSEGRLTRDPTDLVRGPRRSRPLPHSLDVGDVERLLEAPSRDTALPPWRRQRDRALLEVLYAAGARVSEAVGLTTDGIEPGLRVLRLFGKGKKVRLVPCNERARAALETWLADGRTRLAGHRQRSEVFLTKNGAPLDRSTAWRIVRRCALSAGLNGDVSPHTLRHAFATHLIEGGADLRSVQEMLGHASITTTEIYTHVDGEKLLALHRLYHPRA